VWGAGHPLPTLYPLGAFGASIRLASLALGTALFSTPNRPCGTTCVQQLLKVTHAVKLERNNDNFISDDAAVLK